MGAPELIVIADERGRAALPIGVADGCIRIIDWRDADGLSSIGAAPVVIDVDLHDISKVKLIKDNLPDRTGARCRIIAVERGSHQSLLQAQGLGATDVLSRPFDGRALKDCLERHRRQANGDDKARLEHEPGGRSVASAALTLDRMFSGLISGGPLDLASVEQAGDQVLSGIRDVGLAQWLATVRRYHESTFQHCLIVTGVATAFGHKTGMRKGDVLTLTVAGLLHDVGKAQIPVEILDKPGRLTEEEFAVIKRHPVAGYDYIRAQNVVDRETLDAIRHHHEYLDGSGYPDGLAGQQIDDLTRIMTVCDVYGALVERRAYKAPKSPEAALDILTGMANDGKVEYDLVRALRRCVSA
ncbi:MAG TPA: HD domain-containing phosphohydrolase [Xanthobacteraceae bacterium]|nr:HD domain-containing phosphohydrolase [Xanthobacteraceae bacterium]